MGIAFIAVFAALATVMFLQRFGVFDRLRGIRTIDAFAAKTMLREQKAVILDVRSHEEWAAARIPGSRHMPLKQIAGRLVDLEEIKNAPVILSCRSGRRSAAACALLKKNGFDAYNLRGGLNGWASAKYSLDLNELKA